MITSFEVDEKVLRELETIAPLSNTITEMASTIAPQTLMNLILPKNL